MATNINLGANVIFVDTSNSSGVINLPYTGDGIGRIITFQDIGDNFGVNPLTLATINGDTFEDRTTVRDFLFSGLTLTMIAGPNGIWFQSRIVGYTGATGASGSPGSTGTSGDRYLTASIPTYINPTTNPNETFQVETGLAYMPGIYVTVVDSTNINNYFNALVQSYDKTTGLIILTSFSNINGLFGYPYAISYNVNLEGIMGPTGPTGMQGIPGTATNTGATGPQGLTGPPGVAGPLSTKGYYVSKTLEGLQTVDKVVIFDHLDITQSQGNFDAVYDTNTGILSNPTPYQLVVLFNFVIAGPNGYPWSVKIKDNTSSQILWSWSLYPNQSGSENFNTTIILKPSHQVSIVFNEANGSQVYRFQKNSTRILFTQLDYILGAVGPTGQSGIDGIPGTAVNTGATGTTGPRGIPGLATNTGATGPPGTVGALPSKTFYYTQNTSKENGATFTFTPDAVDTNYSFGLFSGTYDPTTGILTNNTENVINYIVDIQLAADTGSSVYFSFKYSYTDELIWMSNYIDNSTINSDSHTITLYPNQGFYTSCYVTNNVGNWNILGNNTSKPSRVKFTQLEYVMSGGGGGGGGTGGMGPPGDKGDTGPRGIIGPIGDKGDTGPAGGGTGFTGPTGPSVTKNNIPSVSYYLTEPISTITGQLVDVVFDNYDAQNSDGTVSFSYSTESGLLNNTSQETLTLLVSGQITTDNTQFDASVTQPVIYVVKNNDNIISSSVINFQGSSFSSSVIISPGDTVKIQYKQYFQNTVNINSGRFNTRITFSQLDYIVGVGGGGVNGTGGTGPTGDIGAPGDIGPTGDTGPPGLAITMYSITFDGGSSSNSYIAGPAFDCGSSI